MTTTKYGGYTAAELTDPASVQSLLTELDWCIANGNTGPRSSQAIECARAVIAALSARAEATQAGAVPGWRLVPIEPDLKMVIAGENYIGRHAWAKMLAAAPQPPVADAARDDSLAIESALFELINKIDSNLDTGDVVQDARRASAALDVILSKGDLVANAHDHLRDSHDRYEKSIEFRIGWNACLDAIEKARAAAPAHQPARASEAVALPDEPKQFAYDVDAVRIGTCEQCSRRGHLHPLDGAMTCGNCRDQAHLEEWKDYAQQLRALLAPAQQAVTLTDDARELDWLENWLNFAAEPVGQECCGHGERGECCGNPEPVYRSAVEVFAAMGARHRELRAALQSHSEGSQK